MRGFHPTEWRFSHRTADGQVLWLSGIGDVDMEVGSAEHLAALAEQPWTPNALADEGEQDMLSVYFRAGTAPTNFYIGLVNDTPVETDTVATLTGEPSGNGYARQLVERNSTGWPTLALDSGDYRVVSGEETFTASGGSIGPVTYSFLTTTSSGTAGLLIAYAALSASRTLAAGETLGVTARVKLA